jgi:hypothetical protein
MSKYISLIVVILAAFITAFPQVAPCADEGLVKIVLEVEGMT